MELLRKVFISTDESRLRSGWRILLQVVLMLFGFFIVANLFDTLSSLAPILAFLADPMLISFAAITLSVYFARRWYDRRSFRSLGLNWNAAASRDLLVGIFIPGLLFGLIFLAETAFGWVDFNGFASNTGQPSLLASLGYWAAAFIMVGWYEELMTRGYWMQNIADGLGINWAVFISSAFFALGHFANPGASWASALGILAAGYFLAFAYLRSKQLWLPIGLHIGWNFFEGPIFSFPVSGLQTAKLLVHEVNGPELITGGAFGPEAGLIVLPALTLGAVLIYFYTQRFSLSREKKQ